jgi:hypothetical protein
MIALQVACLEIHLEFGYPEALGLTFWGAREFQTGNFLGVL